MLRLYLSGSGLTIIVELRVLRLLKCLDHKIHNSVSKCRDDESDYCIQDGVLCLSALAGVASREGVHNPAHDNHNDRDNACGIEKRVGYGTYNIGWVAWGAI